MSDHLWVASVAVVALAYGLHEWAVMRLPMPQIHWQVPARWSRYGKVVQLLLYGLVLGADIFTLVPYASSYILLLLEATLGVSGGAIIGLVYSLARVGPTLVGVIASYRRRNPLSIMLEIMDARNRLHVVNGLALAVVGALLLGGVWPL